MDSVLSFHSLILFWEWFGRNFVCLFVCFPLWWELAGASQTDLRVSSCCCCRRRVFVLLRSPSFVVVFGRVFFGVWTLEGVFWLYAYILCEWGFPSCSEEKLCLIAKQLQGTWVASLSRPQDFWRLLNCLLENQIPSKDCDLISFYYAPPAARRKKSSAQSTWESRFLLLLLIDRSRDFISRGDQIRYLLLLLLLRSWWGTICQCRWNQHG